MAEEREIRHETDCRGGSERVRRAPFEGGLYTKVANAQYFVPNSAI